MIDTGRLIKVQVSEADYVVSFNGRTACVSLSDDDVNYLVWKDNGPMTAYPTLGEAFIAAERLIAV